MSMIGEYRRIDPNKLLDLLKDPESVTNYLFEVDEPENSLNSDKTWQIIHFLLNDDAWEGNDPFFNAVLGGTEFEETYCGYGPARYLLPDKVAETAQALAGLTP